jgi:signal peptidase II
MNPRNLVFVTTLVLGLIADQASKVWVMANIEPVVGEIPIIPGWFSLVQAHNYGAAFSTMEGMRPVFIVFTVIAVAVIVAVVGWLLETTDRFVPMVLGMIFAGAVGNGIDRLRLGFVVDFLKVFAGEDPLRSWFTGWFGTHIWPIFNVADSLLVVGISLFLLYWAFQRDGEVADEEETTPKVA